MRGAPSVASLQSVALSVLKAERKCPPKMSLQYALDRCAGNSLAMWAEPKLILSLVVAPGVPRNLPCHRLDALPGNQQLDARPAIRLLLTENYRKTNPGKLIVESRAAGFSGERYRENYLGKFLVETNGISMKEGGSCSRMRPSDHYRTHLIGRHLMVSVTIPFGVWFTDQRTPPQKPISTYPSSNWNGVPVDVGQTSRGERWQNHFPDKFYSGGFEYFCKDLKFSKIQLNLSGFMFSKKSF